MTIKIEFSGYVELKESEYEDEIEVVHTALSKFFEENNFSNFKN